MKERRPFCADVSLENAEPLAATASRVDHWILVEYRGLWGARRARRQRPLRADQGPPDGTAPRPARHEAPLRPPDAPPGAPDAGRPLGQLARARRLDRLRRDRGLRGPARARPDLAGASRSAIRCCSSAPTASTTAAAPATGGRSIDALDEQADEDWVWQSSHLGGDRFAGNVVFLPEGLYFGRVGPGEAWPVLDEYLAGRIHLDHYRGRSAYTFAEQAAERAVRERAGCDRDRRPRARRARRLDRLVPRRRAAVRRRGRARAPGALTYLTCSAETLRRPRRYAARILRESAA